jgi:hypothetical protein
VSFGLMITLLVKVRIFYTEMLVTVDLLTEYSSINFSRRVHIRIYEKKRPQLTPALLTKEVLLLGGKNRLFLSVTACKKLLRD